MQYVVYLDRISQKRWFIYFFGPALSPGRWFPFDDTSPISIYPHLAIINVPGLTSFLVPLSPARPDHVFFFHVSAYSSEK